MTRVACAAVFAVLLAGVARGDDTRTAEELAKNVIRLQNELVKQLDAATDRASADRVWPKVAVLRLNWKSAQDELAKRPPQERQSAHEAAVESLGKPADLPAAWARVAKRFPVAPDTPVLAEEARGELAVRQAHVVLAACEAYRAHPKSGNTYPDNLAELLTPPFGGSSFLKNGQEDLVDPWVSPFQLGLARVRTRVNGKDVEVERAYVWTDRTIAGKVRRFTTKPPGWKE
jgi:hypothetical protein